MAQAKAEDVYRENCASCHGAEMEGGSGGALNEGIWKYGASDVEIAASISAGIPDAGMPAFEKALPAESIRALVVYIREKENAARKSGAPKPKTLPGEPVRTEHASYIA